MNAVSPGLGRVLPGGPTRLAYLALETPEPGQAAHTHIHEMTAALEARGWQVSLFLPEPAGRAGRSLSLRLARHAEVQARLLQRLPGFDLLYVRAHPLALPAVLAARRAGLPVVQEINGPVLDLGITYPRLRPLLGALSAMQRAQYRRAELLLPVTPGLADWAAGEAPGVAARVVGNAANTGLFAPHGPRRAHARPYAAFVGTLARWHGIGTMLAALHDPAWPRGVDLLIAGDGVEAPSLRAALAAQPAGPEAPRLHWLRDLPHAAVPALLRGALCALVPIGNPQGRSAHGVLPLKLFEAMACGVPVLASDLPGQAELLRQEGAGLVLPVDDAAALAAGVARLHAEPRFAERLGAAGAEAARARHGWAHRAAEVDRLLAPLAARRRVRA